MAHPFTIIGGLRIGGTAAADTKASRILSGLLARANKVVDGDTLVEAGWCDDPSAGRRDMVRMHRAGVINLLERSGVSGWNLVSMNAGSYRLEIEATHVDLLDVRTRHDRATSLGKQNDFAGALTEAEQAIPSVRGAINSIGAISPAHATAWINELQAIRDLRRSILDRYFGTILTRTHHDNAQLLRALNAIDLESVASEKLWRIKVGLTAEVEGMQPALRSLSDAKIALERLSVPHALDSQSVEAIHAGILGMSKKAGPRFNYSVPLWFLPHDPVDTENAQIRWSAAVRRDLATECERLLNRRVTGSSILALRDMTLNSSLRMPARATIRSGPFARDSIEDAVSLLIDDLLKGNRRYMVIAPPGTGKSLICRLIFLGLAERFLADGTAVPELVDLRSSTLPAASDLSRDRQVLILDSLDELLASGTLAQVRQAVEDEVLEQASVIACRTQFYEQFLTGTTLLEGRTVIEIHAWDTPTIEAYIDAYYRHIFKAEDMNVVADLKRRLESPNVESLLSIPLRLNMALDLIPPGDNNLPTDLNSLSLHRQWIQTTLRNESARRGSVLEPEEKLRFLTTLAWRFYDEGTPGIQSAPSFTDADVQQVISEMMIGATQEEIRQAVRDVESYSILVSAEPDGGGTTLFDSFEFQHKTYQEFLVARYVMNSALSGPEAAASVFRQHLSPQVSDFIKDDFKNSGRTPGQAQRLATNLQQALASYDRESARNLDSVRLRSTTQQICYYLASLPLTPVRDAMLDRLAAEKDPWVARAIAIGLSFGGETRGLDQYIESLRRERQLGRSTDINDLNIGYHLSFFGDQPFDPVQPFLDQKLESVSSTVSRLIYQLSIETDFGSWRLDLYAILDLYRHRTQSKASCVSTIIENRDRLIWVLDQFKVDARTRNWPEVQDLEVILAEIGIIE